MTNGTVPPPEKTVGHLQHPDITPQWSDWVESRTLHLVAPYSNPFRWETRRRLANDAIRHLRSCPNVELYVVELCYGDRPPEITGHHPNDIILRTNAELWHKEQQIRIGVSRFPWNWEYGGYCDLDFRMGRHDWALEAIQLLQMHAFVQNFNSYTDVTAETPHSYTGHRPYRMNSSFAWNFLHQQQFLQSMMKRNGIDAGYFKRYRPSKAFPFGFWPGAPGGSWSWRKDAWDKVGGLLDTCILGSGDYHVAVGLAGLPDEHAELKLGLPGYTRAIKEWQQHAKVIEGNIGCCDNFAVHHFHGNKRMRGYGDRPDILRRHGFDPYSDIKRDWQGLWQLSGSKPRLRDDIRKYFLSRDEDNPTLLDSPGPLV